MTGVRRPTSPLFLLLLLSLSLILYFYFPRTPSTGNDSPTAVSKIESSIDVLGQVEERKAFGKVFEKFSKTEVLPFMILTGEVRPPSFPLSVLHNSLEEKFIL